MDKTRNVACCQAQVKAPANHAFTLVELLVVIGIVAVLAAIMLPVFGHVRENGRRTTCQSNLRQIAVAVQQYVQDNDGIYPKSQNPRTINGVAILVLWPEILLPYTKSRAVFYCPSRPQGIQSDDFMGDEGYSFNHMRLNLFGPIKSYGVHESHLPFPATTWLNVDRVSVWKHQCQFCESAPSSCGRSFSGSILHSGGGNYSFLDGHVKWHTVRAMAEIECQNGPEPPPLEN